MSNNGIERPRVHQGEGQSAVIGKHGGHTLVGEDGIKAGRGVSLSEDSPSAGAGGGGRVGAEASL